jgi:limonene-1,2-epoxide hydrolase
MTPKEIVRGWVEAFNSADADRVAGLYAEQAVNHQVHSPPVVGREAIRAMFTREFAAAKMVCQIENLFEDGDWAILEWSDPLGLRGCGFFHIAAGKIVFQRGYWDRLTLLQQRGLPLEPAL